VDEAGAGPIQTMQLQLLELPTQKRVAAQWQLAEEVALPSETVLQAGW
jgi:hypothetical protein